MGLDSYPIVRYYLEQAEAHLEKEFYLGALLIVATLSELLVREITGDTETRLKRLLDRLHCSHSISEEQFELFDEIREIRNLYVHLDLGKFAYSHGIENNNGNIALVNEILQSSKYPAEELVDFYKSMVRNDSITAFGIVKRAIATF